MLNLTRSAAEYLQRQLGLSQDETEVIRYGIQIIVYSLADILTICLVGWLLGCFWTTVTVALTAGSLRLLSGGAHSSSPVVCNILGMIMVPLLAKTAEFAAVRMTQPLLLSLVLIGAFISLLIIYFLAPVDSAAKPITNEQERRRFKQLSLALVFLFLVGQITFILLDRSPVLVLAVSLGTWWQAFTLTPASHRFASRIDQLFLRRC
ncbi:MAG: accessory gene regulator B family protein [Syntrophomonadaceae bacterium]|nr:accessory gene regulator B family protein [Syntrophomonadaceae bacterium]